jgi:hypothetical protein
MSSYKIQIDGSRNTVNDPISLENLLMIYKKSIPDNYVDFVDSPIPTTGVYEVIDGYNYVDEGTHFSKQYIVRQMTSAEITSKQAEVKASWAAVGYPSWTFNDSKCCFEPPIVNPSSLSYSWDEESKQWMIVE